jgi:spheroidene monooxygenase
MAFGPLAFPVMIASLDLARFPLGVAEREALAARRAGRRSDAHFARLLLGMRLRSMPVPVPQMTVAYYFALWRDEAALERFRAGPLRRWDDAREHLALTLRPVQSFGAWGGADPLRGEGSEPRPGPVALITHSRVRAGKAARFFAADGPVVRALDHADGRLWSDGFFDDLARLDSGTLSLWRDTAAATAFAYGPGVHQRAVKAQREGGWFSESWFARFAIEAARGSWQGVGERDLLVPATVSAPPHPASRTVQRWPPLAGR